MFSAVYLGHRFYTTIARNVAFLSFIPSNNIKFLPECHAPNILNMIPEHKCEKWAFFLPCTPMTLLSNRCTILSSQPSNSLQPIFTSRIGRCLRNFTAIKSSLSFLVMKAASLPLSPTHPHFHHSLILSLSHALPFSLLASKNWHTEEFCGSGLAHDSVLIHTNISSPNESRNRFLSFETPE